MQKIQLDAVRQLDPNMNSKRAAEKNMINSFLVCRTEHIETRPMPSPFHEVIPCKYSSINNQPNKYP